MKQRRAPPLHSGKKSRDFFCLRVKIVGPVQPNAGSLNTSWEGTRERPARIEESEACRLEAS